MRRCWLKGSDGDALHAVLCAAGFNIRWLLRTIARGGIGTFLFALMALRLLSRLMPMLALNGSSHHHHATAPGLPDAVLA
jgi:IS5 family transposase